MKEFIEETIETISDFITVLYEGVIDITKMGFLIFAVLIVVPFIPLILLIMFIIEIFPRRRNQ